jgi:hypothetical protein
MGTGPPGEGGPFSGLTDLITFLLSFFPLLAAFLVLFAISNSSPSKNQAAVAESGF